MNATRLRELENTLLPLGFRAEAHDSTGYAENWYIRPVSGGGGAQRVRVVIHVEDGERVEVYSLDRHGSSEYSAAFAGSTPVAVIRATVCAMAGVR